MFHRRAEFAHRVVVGLLVLLSAGPSTSVHASDCGISRTSSLYVIGGKNATPHEFPWQVSLQDYVFWLSPPWLHFCGGALIDQQWILTAAHCISPPRRRWRIALGKHNLAIDEPLQVVQTPALHIPHPYFSSATKDYDFGLVKLSTPLNFTGDHGHLTPICLPSSSDFSSFDGKICTSSGWGRTSINGYAGSDILQKITVRPVPNSQCRLQYALFGFEITRRMICASPTVRGEMCNGDSGGPLQCLSGGRYVLIGDVSFGSCGRYPPPTSYGRVSEVLDWINEVRREK